MAGISLFVSASPAPPRLPRKCCPDRPSPRSLRLNSTHGTALREWVLTTSSSCSTRRRGACKPAWRSAAKRALVSGCTHPLLWPRAELNHSRVVPQSCHMPVSSLRTLRHQPAPLAISVCLSQRRVPYGNNAFSSASARAAPSSALAKTAPRPACHPIQLQIFRKREGGGREERAYVLAEHLGGMKRLKSRCPFGGRVICFTQLCTDQIEFQN